MSKNRRSLIISLSVIVLLSGCAGAGGNITDQFQQKAKRINQLLAEYNGLLQEVNRSIDNQYSYQQKVRGCSKWLAQHKNEIYEFQAFIESNRAQLQTVVANLDEIRNNTTELLKNIQENEAKFRTVIPN